MTVLGDPYLLRQGIGCFELINYYPTADGETLKYNPIVSGVYFPQQIVHRISVGDYTTEISAMRIPTSVDNTATQTYMNVVSNAVNSGNTQNDFTIQLDQLMQVNLETLTSDKASKASSNFTQTTVLTNVLLQGNLKSTMDQAFADFTAINTASGNSTNQVSQYFNHLNQPKEINSISSPSTSNLSSDSIGF
jgi:hypothetical protein